MISTGNDIPQNNAEKLMKSTSTVMDLRFLYISLPIFTTSIYHLDDGLY